MMPTCAHKLLHYVFFRASAYNSLVILNKVSYHILNSLHMQNGNAETGQYFVTEVYRSKHYNYDKRMLKYFISITVVI